MRQTFPAECKKMNSLLTYVALLRGINVGDNRKVEMAKLKQAFERLGLVNVKTFIASGNVIFQADLKDRKKLAQTIESAIKSDFKIDVKVLLRHLKDMGKLVKAIPASWVNDKTTKCDIMFLTQEADKKSILKRLPSNSAIEEVRYVPGAVLWHIDRDTANKSRMFRIVGTELYQQMTVRNPNTVRKLYELMVETAKS